MLIFFHRRLEAEQNPDLVTRDHLAFARERNDATRGRVLATRALRDTMLAGIEALNITPTLPPAEQRENAQSTESSDHSKDDSMQ
jgi:hypothetical protein